jgi:hypothetical protein
LDITDALAPTSDQLDAVELVNPRTFTIDTGSALGQREGKTVAEIRLADFPRVWRPSKGMLDVLAACWGTDAKQWVGHRVTVYNDPEVMFGRDKVGGIRISHLSHIDKARSVTIRASGAGRKKPWCVEPLADAALARRDGNPRDALLAEIGALADKTSGGRKAVAADWAETHDGQSLRDATDLGGLELLRDDLRVSA